jgi:beta-lactam-binding protein with PASTA domain
MPRTGTFVRVPDLIGMETVEAAGLLREVGLRPGVVRLEWSRVHGTGIVVSQGLPPGSWVEKRSRIDLRVSMGLFRQTRAN